MRNMISLMMASFVAVLTIVGAWSIAYDDNEPEYENQPPSVELSRFAIAESLLAGLPINELSALAWDADEQLLYAISDKGSVFHFRITLEGNNILSTESLYGGRLTTTENPDSPRTGMDAEGLTLLNANNGQTGDTELVVAI